MKSYKISACENLNLITIRNIESSLGQITDFLDNNDMELVTCNVKPSGLVDAIIVAPDKYISTIASVFKKETTPYNAITIRSGICRLSISSPSNSSISIARISTKYFENQQICIERISTSKKETQIFFPALEVCGCLKKFINGFEANLDLNFKKELC